MQILQKVILAVILLTATLPAISSAQDRELTTFILFRHAETDADGTRDPGLSEAGRKRAARLAGHLKAADITAVYSTAFKRTTDTARPTAALKGLEIREYDPFDQKNAAFDSGQGTGRHRTDRRTFEHHPLLCQYPDR